MTFPKLFICSLNSFIESGHVKNEILDKNDHSSTDLSLSKTLKQEAISRHGFRISMEIAGVSIGLWAVPVVGYIVYPVIAGLALLSAAAFFAYRHKIIAPRLNELNETRNEDLFNTELDNYDDIGNYIEEVAIPTINWKQDLKEGFECFALVGVINLYVIPFFERMSKKDNNFWFIL